MYKILLDGMLFSDSRIPDLAIIEPVIELGANQAGSMSFTVPSSHPYADRIKRKTTFFEVYRDDEKEPIFAGICNEIREDFFKQKKIELEGELTFLNDTIQRPAKWQNMTPRTLLESYITRHNEQCGAGKEFYVGNVTVTDPNNNIYCFTNYENTMTAIKEDLVDDLGGYIVVRHEDGKRYIDYLAEDEHINTQIITLGENLIDFKSNLDMADIATGIIPLGALLDESSIEGLDERVTIKSVNNDSDCIISEAAAEEFGYIFKTITWDNVTKPENLFTKAKKYLQDTQFDAITIEANAIDLYYEDNTKERLKLLDKVRVLSRPHGLDRYFVISKQKIYLNNPEKDKITLGKKENRSLTALSSEISSGIKERAEEVQKSAVLDSAKKKASQLIHTATHGYVVLNYDDNGAYELLIMDTADVNTATKVWRWNMGGFGYSSHGYNGTYDIAMTMDGSIVANFITTGTMYADRIMGGTLTMGGYDNQNGVIKVKDSSGNVCVTIDCTGIKVGNNFSVNMKGNVVCHNIKADGTDFSDSVDSTEAMRLAKQAIAKAQEAADKAQKASDENASTVKNLNNTIIPDILKQINDLYQKVAALS